MLLPLTRLRECRRLKSTPRRVPFTYLMYPPYTFSPLSLFDTIFNKTISAVAAITSPARERVERAARSAITRIYFHCFCLFYLFIDTANNIEFRGQRMPR